MTLVSETIRASRQQATAHKTPELVTTSPTHAIGLIMVCIREISLGTLCQKRKKATKKSKNQKPSRKRQRSRRKTPRDMTSWLFEPKGRLEISMFGKAPSKSAGGFF
jgi:hypothetical protein